MNIITSFRRLAKDEGKRAVMYVVLGLAAIFAIIGFFDKELAAGLLTLLVLSAATLFLMYAKGLQDKEIYSVFLLALLVHLGAVLFIYYGHFKPFGGGADYEGYNQIAIELASRFGDFNFSLEGLYTDHFFPILIGVLYLVTLPGMLVGQLFTVWLAAVSMALMYLLVLEIGGTKRIAFWACVLAIFYPSYLYFGSILLKDTMVIPLVLLALLLSVKMAKRFSWYKFCLFFVALTCLINLRFYVGYALLLSFIISWPILSAFAAKKKLTYWLAMVVLLGFSSFIVGNGYYGLNSFKTLFNKKMITYYREVVYSPGSPLMQPTPEPENGQSGVDGGAGSAQHQGSSTFFLETGFDKGPVVFLRNSLQSFVYSLLGPLPWQFSQKRQVVALAETIPWYAVIIISVYSSVMFLRKRGAVSFLAFHKFTLPLLVFGILAIGALSLFINNYGIIARIRIPMLICFLCMMLIGFNDSREKNT